ncbi:MAG: hypothetical protein L3J66_09695 [Bacteroidales bacterium]|nr:hypothetical protein [Bacteroidales bacterium]
MLAKLKQTVFRNNKKKVSEIMNDIHLFYQYIDENGQLIDYWYFDHVFTANYWNYLRNYKWLSSHEQDFLHRGILSMLLFMGYLYLDGKADPFIGHLSEIKSAVANFHSHKAQNKKLSGMVNNALDLAEKKQGGHFNSETHTDIFKSISWTLKSIVLANKTVFIKHETP